MHVNLVSMLYVKWNSCVFLRDRGTYGNVIGKQNEFTNKVDTDLHAHALVWFNFLCNVLGWIANWNSNGGRWEVANIKH